VILVALAFTLIVFALYSGFRAIKYAVSGQAFVFTDMSGRGLAGMHDRATEPVWFWTVVIMHGASSIAGILIGGGLLLTFLGW
jgi:hypothetical protein